jgi:hypothetical protein
VCLQVGAFPYPAGGLNDFDGAKIALMEIIRQRLRSQKLIPDMVAIRVGPTVNDHRIGNVGSSVVQLRNYRDYRVTHGSQVDGAQARPTDRLPHTTYLCRTDCR